MFSDQADTLSGVIRELIVEGFNENFEAKEDSIIGNFSKNQYQPEELIIVKSYRFEGMSNPSDQTLLFAIKAKDGTEGTLVVSYQAKHNQNIELIKKIKTLSK